MRILTGIYKITSPSEKIYIGQSVNIRERWRQYKYLNCKGQIGLYNSFLKYGIDRHKFDIICICETEKLNELEKYYIDLFQTFNTKYGLNLRDGGGNNGILSDETKRKISESESGKIIPEDVRKKISESMTGNKNHFYGKVHSEYSKKIIGEKSKNRNTFTIMDRIKSV